MALLQIDQKNAFSIISRALFIPETRMRFPKMFRWVEYCYRENVRPQLWVGDRRFLSVFEVQQGDPLGPELFALAMESILVDLNNQMRQQAREHEPHEGNQHSPALLASYVDDSIVIVEHWLLTKVLDYLQSDKVVAHGLDLKLDKFNIWWPTAPE